MRTKLLVFLGCALMVGGAFAFGWYGYVQLQLFRVQREASRLLENQKKALTTQSPPRVLVNIPLRSGELLGRIEIPRLHISVMVLEGTSPEVLRVAAGHIQGTALPGIGGNTGIAAHRDTFFRPLRAVQPQDRILLTTSYGTFRYIVDTVKIVNPTDVQVLAPTSEPGLTLVTCYPFTYAGAAPRRFIVHAQSEAGRSCGQAGNSRMDAAGKLESVYSIDALRALSRPPKVLMFEVLIMLTRTFADPRLDLHAGRADRRQFCLNFIRDAAGCRFFGKCLPLLSTFHHRWPRSQVRTCTRL